MLGNLVYSLLELCPRSCEFGLTLTMIVDLRVVFLMRLSTDLNFSTRVTFTVFFFISPLSDHSTHCQLGEDVWGGRQPLSF